MTTIRLSSLPNAALLAEAVRAAGDERRATTDLVALLAEVDARRLYLGQGYPSLFAWCTDTLRLSEPSAYSRIAAARATRRYPVILKLLADGDVTLTTVTLLAAHLTDENHEALLDAARHTSKRGVERLVASLVPQPDIASSLRNVASAPARTAAGRLDETDPAADRTSPAASDAPLREERHSMNAAPEAHSGEQRVAPAATGRSIVAPLASDRYLLKITLTGEARRRLDRARDLLRHAVPSGDPAVIVDRALTVLVEQLERSRCAVVRRPPARRRATTAGRHVPASVRRAVWTRDDGRCAFVGADGRCRETGWLEIHHVVPFARGGLTTTENLELRCRAHNAYEAEREFGARVPSAAGSPRPATTTLSGQSSQGAATSRQRRELTTSLT